MSFGRLWSHNATITFIINFVGVYNAKEGGVLLAVEPFIDVSRVKKKEIYCCVRIVTRTSILYPGLAILTGD